MKNLIFLIFAFIYIYIANAQLNDMDNEEEMIKKTKVLACIAITKARMAQDSVNIKK
jgi:hypothetical protein